MATSERTLPTDPTQEAARSKALAERYYHEFVDLREVRIDHDLFTTIPVDLMFRYNFVPIQATNGSLEIARYKFSTSQELRGKGKIRPVESRSCSITAEGHVEFMASRVVIT